MLERTKSRGAAILSSCLAVAACAGSSTMPTVAAPSRTSGAIEVRIAAGRPMSLSPASQPEVARILSEGPTNEPPRARAERVIRWIHRHVSFTADRHRSIDGVLEDRAGNCFDHAVLAMAMLRTAGLVARPVRELNVQTPSEGRGARAREAQSSLFGYEHNDHTWIEVNIDDAWIPADSSLGVFGVREWLAARALRGTVNDYGMIVPFAIVAYDDERPVDRTAYYLDEALLREFPGVERASAWTVWRDDARHFASRSLALLAGHEDMIAERARIHRMAEGAAALRRTLVDAGIDVGAASPLDAYLSAFEAGGARYCLDPESKRLRADVKRARFEEGDMLDAAELADDVRDFHVAIKSLYSGYPELAESPRFAIGEFFADWEADVRGAAGGRVSFGDGVLRPLIEIRRNIRDNHLAPWGWGSKLAKRAELAFSEYQTMGRVAGFDAAACRFEGVMPVAGTAAFAKVATRGGLADVTTFSAQSVAPAVDVRCGDRSVRFDRRQPSHLHAKEDAPPYEWRVIGDATVIVVRRLYGSPKDLALLAEIAKDYDRHRVKPVVVFDFRGNGGGDDGYVYEWVEKAVRGSFPAPYVELQLTEARAPCGDWNQMVTEQMDYERIDTPEARAERDAYRANNFGAASSGRPVQTIGETVSVTKAKVPYRGRVFALVDHGSGSSGESAPDMLRVAMGATIVGERTGGYAEFGNIRPYVMTRTGVIWQLSSKRNYYTSPRDGVGHPVDVYLPPELLSAPVEELLPLLEKLPKR